METIIEKKVYEEGKHHDKEAERIARNARGWGIAGVVTGGLALASQLWKGGNPLAPASAPVVVAGGGGGCCGVNAYAKECEDVLALTNAMWSQKVGTMADLYAMRNTDIAEKFALYKSQTDADIGLYKSTRDGLDVLGSRLNNELFGLYKYTRDANDATNKEISNLKAELAVCNAVRPYQDKLILCEIDKAHTAAMNALDRRTCRMITGELVLPSTPTVTGYPSYNPCNPQPAAA